MWEIFLTSLPAFLESASHRFFEESRKNSEAIDVEAYYIDDRLILATPKDNQS
jgi:hypothetical protein